MILDTDRMKQVWLGVCSEIAALPSGPGKQLLQPLAVLGHPSPIYTAFWSDTLKIFLLVLSCIF